MTTAFIYDQNGKQVNHRTFVLGNHEWDAIEWGSSYCHGKEGWKYTCKTTG
jgi:hypothetical protein